ncbi:hypothetical protein (plasmid) [Lactobacillus brevis] [Lactiplantibacillus mudanjiangensis]|uniref:KxYKxGKxW signal peptide domain-containing protein n=1 Tax=Lactiplantibacillus mudanjiangensis TaxID=1296538 RepID=UPI0010143994|nr:KxYKxGKxW signal peptide domain-containing protein [Lactiplantibacillus mudanjiangensis]VDG33710.1 hypothetical protein (plasmid) [Lactobacillus brevis] [Lactiplantibacillus mudanjiangensis]
MKKQQFMVVNGVTHYKLYKSGKRWLVGSITALVLTAGLSAYQPFIGHADSTADTSINESTTASDAKAVVTSATSANPSSQATSSAISTNSVSDTAKSATIHQISRNLTLLVMIVRQVRHQLSQ